MVDTPPIDPTLIKDAGDVAKEAATNIDHLGAAASLADDAFNLLGSQIKDSGSKLNGFTSALKEMGIAFNVTKGLTADQITQFSLLSNAMLGARESYRGLIGVDSSGLDTFTEQLQYITSTLGNTESGIGALVSVAKDAFGKEVPKAIAGSFDAVSVFVANLAKSADNALKLQNAVLQLAGQTGNLNSVFKLAGPNLENINDLLEKHAKMMSDASNATGVAPEQVEKYYSQLGQVPGALEALVTSAGNAQQKTSMLTAAMQVAAGTGRKFDEVIDDLKVAFRDYGLTGENALKFSAEISKITQNLGVELNVVRDALKSGAESFKMFAGEGDKASRMASGLADIMNNYAGALKASGLNGTAAVEIMKNMTNQISQMGIAQKSFLSAQTGGAGGLMGAFQIDKMMRDGDIKGVFEKVREQMKKQFGRIVTLDEASQSQAAAAQMTKQMMILKQGPLGQFAKTDVEAQRLLEGFAKAEGGEGGGGIGLDVLKESMDRGESVQEKSYTVLTEMRGHLESIRKSADIGTLSFMQKSGLTAGVGAGLADTVGNDAAYAARIKLKAGMKGAINMTTKDQQETLDASVTRGKLSGTPGYGVVTAITDLGDSFAKIPNMIKGPAEAIKKAFLGGDMKSATENLKLFEEGIKQRKASLKDVPLDKRNSLMDEIKKEEAILTQSKSHILGAPVAPPGVRVGSAAVKASGTPLPGVPGVGAGVGMSSVAPKLGAAPIKQDVNVHVTGFCLKCKQEIDNAGQLNINPQGKSI